MNFAGRLPVGSTYPLVTAKKGPSLTRSDSHGSSCQVLACGLACSEIFHGPTLARLLSPAHSLEAAALSALRSDQPAPPLAIHTSAGIPPNLGKFLEALLPHLPPHFQGDNLASLQLTGSDAVWAGVDLLLQLCPPGRDKVAVGRRSYHGPGTSAFGSASPLGAAAKTPLQVEYPTASVLDRRPGESESAHCERATAELGAFLRSPEGCRCGVLLLEPQSGSSSVGQPYPRHLLEAYVALAHAHGLLVLADEIMCGLGRHGLGPAFVSTAWNLQVDALAFGKAAACGVEPLAGAVLARGFERMKREGRTVFQSHTYAGASARAMETGRAVFEELQGGAWSLAAGEMGRKVVEPLMQAIKEESGGCFNFHGQGLMWGGFFVHSSDAERKAAVEVLKEKCAAAEVLPYYVPAGGFMFTPVLDAPKTMLEDALGRLRVAVGETCRTMREERGWTGSWTGAGALGTLGGGEATRTRTRYKGPRVEDMTDKQKEIHDEIGRTRTTGTAGPFGPWLANAGLANHAQNLGRTCRCGRASANRRL